MVVVELGISLLIIIISVIIFTIIFLYIIKMAKDTEKHAKELWCIKNKTLLSEMQTNFEIIYTQTKSFQEQVKLLYTVVEKNIDDEGSVESAQVLKFRENLINLNNLLDECQNLTNSFSILQKQKCDTDSPETFHDVLLKEYEIFQKILVIYNQVRSLLNENVAIVGPLIKEKSK